MLNKTELRDLIELTISRSNINDVIIEKDYYVCLILKELSNKQDKLKAYFKGGTAVYKILNNMMRFSEDVDLTVEVVDYESKTQNQKRLKNSALGFEIEGLELMKEKTEDKKGSITSYYKYDSLYSNSNLYKPDYVQIEATSFTVSEPVKKYVIEPLVYKYATDEEKEILRTKYGISEFEIEIIALERIFIDKIFAAEFYFTRGNYEEVSKHLYDISMLWTNEEIKEFMKNKEHIRKIIGLKRKEELVRLGGIDQNLKIQDFSYLNFDYSDNLKKSFSNMQNFYVLNKEFRLEFNEVIDNLKNIKKILIDAEK